MRIKTRRLKLSDVGRWATIRWKDTSETRRGIITDVQIAGGKFLSIDSDRPLAEDFRIDSSWQIINIGAHATE